MIRIHANLPLQTPPKWALLERELFANMNAAIPPLLDKYVHPDGSLMWPTVADHQGVDALDDAYESFHNWPLLYLLGGSDRFLDISLKEFNAITKQFERYDCGFGHPMVVQEYEQGYDWFHQGEGYLFFYLLGLADPTNSQNKERAIRFAGFYLNEDADAQNYDEQLQIIKSSHSGSKGPAYRNFTGEAWSFEDWKAFYGLPYMDVEGCHTIEDMKNSANALQMGKVMKERMSRGDVISNLAATTMFTHAYLYTGADKYKAWVQEYVDAWIKRTEENNGILPDNIGLNGEIGQYIGGKWYGGYYGWTWPHGWLSIGDAAVIAGENAMLLSQNPAYMEFPRSQIDVLTKKGKIKDGTLRVPYKYGDPGNTNYKLWIEGVIVEEDGSIHEDDGWFEFQPMDPKYMTHLWNVSMDPADLQRMKSLRNYDKRDWEQVVSFAKKDQGGHDSAWIAFLQGEFPSYPEQILQHNIAQVNERLRFIESDTQDPASYTDSYLQARNPITVEGLTQLTLGAPLPMYNGGLLLARVRYFDLQRKRPGLPEDVAALIEEMGDERLIMQLVNLNAVEARTVLVQAGAFSEHEFTNVKYQVHRDGNTIDQEAAVNHKWLRVELAPASQVRLDLGMHRYANNPTYEVNGIYEE